MTEQKKSERKIDKDLEDTFPASDPTPGNVFVGAPSEHSCKDGDTECATKNEKPKSPDTSGKV